MSGCKVIYKEGLPNIWNAQIYLVIFEEAVSHIWLCNRGLQCFKLNGNQTEKDRYWQKNNFLIFAKCLKMYSVFRICVLRLQKVLLWPKKFFSRKLSLWVSKTCKILCWFQIHWCRLSEMPLTKVKSKKPRKNAQKRKNSKFA